MIEYLPYMNVNIPYFFQDVFMSLAISSFNLIPFNLVFGKVEFSIDNRAYTDKFDDNGQNTTIVFFNTMDIYVIGLCMFLMIGVYLVIHKICTVTKPKSVKWMQRQKKIRKSINEKLKEYKFKAWILFMKESFLPICVYTMVNIASIVSI